MSKSRLRLETILSESVDRRAGRLALFALLGLGVTESLSSGLMSATDALRSFFTADNCLFVRRKLKEKEADKFMSHGVQLADLFDALPPDEANRQFRHELSLMRSVCLKLLDQVRPAA